MIIIIKKNNVLILECLLGKDYFVLIIKWFLGFDFLIVCLIK